MIRDLLKNLLSLLACMILLSGLAQADGASLETKLQESFARGELDGLHGVLVLKGGERFAEAYFDGADEHWGTPIGMVQHGPDTVHDLRSVSKTMVGLLYGIALSEGKVAGTDASLYAQFPDHADLAPGREAITIRHALNMTLGLEWDETLPYSDPRNSEIAMERSGDKLRFVLSRPVVSPPGQVWTYSGGATALIGSLIEQGTGQPLDVYAETKLFAPLGITTAHWTKGLDGKPSAASGLRMSARDLGRIGQMVLDGGRAGGRQIVPEAWVEESLTPAAKTTSGLRYSHFWWHAPEGTPPLWSAGLGNGGQRLVINRKDGIAVVLFAGMYNHPDAWRLGKKVIAEFITPSLLTE